MTETTQTTLPAVPATTRRPRVLRLLAGGAAAVLALTGLAAAVPASAGAAASAPLPGSVKHTDGKYWAFYAPRGWIAAYGAYGITITSPDGDDTLDLGFSSVLCASGTTARQSAANFLGNQRQQVLANSGLRKVKVKKSSFGQLPAGSYGPNYFRATTLFQGKAPGQGKIRVSMVNDYSFYDTTYCFNRNVALAAPKKGSKAAFSRLTRVWQTLAYFGPGSCDPQNETSCPVRPTP